MSTTNKIYVAGKCDICPHNDGVISNSDALVWSSWRNSEKKLIFSSRQRFVPEKSDVHNFGLVAALIMKLTGLKAMILLRGVLES